MMKFTEINHIDYTDIVDTYVVVSQLFEVIQDLIEKAEVQTNLMTVLSKISVTDQAALDLFTGKRRFIREVAVVVTEGKNKKKRKLFFFNDLIILTKYVPSPKGYYKLKKVVYLDENMSIENVGDSAGKISL
jgi:hypothetical protein